MRDRETLANYNREMVGKRMGQALKRTRIARKATQAQVAQALGITQAFLSMIEEGQRVPGDALIGKISDWISSGPTPGKSKRGPYKT